MSLVSKTFKELFGELQTEKELFRYSYLNYIKNNQSLYISKVIKDDNIVIEVAITNEYLATKERLKILHGLHNQLNTQW